MVFEKRVTDASVAYMESGNVFLDKLFGANIREVENGSDMNMEMENISSDLKERGMNPYIIPGGGSNPIGALGYVDCILELISQANSMNVVIDKIIHATGSAGTQAGIVVGVKALNSKIPVLGIGVNADKDKQEEKVFKLACELCDFLGMPGLVERKDIIANCDYVGDGYGVPTDEMNAAILMLARQEGLLFDPVYSGKGLAGMIDLINKGQLKKDENIVFIHTGGSAGLFAYHDLLKTK